MSNFVQVYIEKCLRMVLTVTLFDQRLQCVYVCACVHMQTCVHMQMCVHACVLQLTISGKQSSS